MRFIGLQIGEDAMFERCTGRSAARRVVPPETRFKPVVQTSLSTGINRSHLLHGPLGKILPVFSRSQEAPPTSPLGFQVSYFICILRLSA